MLNKIKERIKKFSCIVTIYENSILGYYKLRTRIFEEVRKYRPVHYGDKNRGKFFFRISFEHSSLGLYSTIFEIVIPYCQFALRRGWIPVVDLKDMYMPLMQDEDKKGIENSWEYYYEQPIRGYTLENLYQSRNVLEAKWWYRKVKGPQWKTMYPTSKKKMKYWHDFIQSYIRLNSNIENRIALERERIFKPGHKVLGVGIRAGLRAGAMRQEKLYNNHPKQPTCEELMDIVEDKMNQWGCDYIFLSCDDREYFNKFRTKWGDKCWFVDRKLLHYFENDVPVPTEQMYREFRDVTVRKRNEDYIVETYLLAQCNSCYSSHGGGATFAYFLNGGQYEYIEIYDGGVYSGL